MVCTTRAQAAARTAHVRIFFLGIMGDRTPFRRIDITAQGKVEPTTNAALWLLGSPPEMGRSFEDAHGMLDGDPFAGELITDLTNGARTGGHDLIDVLSTSPTSAMSRLPTCHTS